MRILSKTQDEGRVVELSKREWIEFYKLTQAIEGKEQADTWNFEMRGERFGIDTSFVFDGVFGAIEAFYLAKFRVNEMQRAVDAFRHSVEPH